VLAVGERWPVLLAQASAYDFYMVPHCSIMKGTCQPSHFHVVYDDLKLSPDDLQAFMYQLCHAYGRATKVVSRPAPVYYAHLAAFHASFYNVKYKADAEVYGAWGETASVTSGSHATTQTAAADIQAACSRCAPRRASPRRTPQPLSLLRLFLALSSFVSQPRGRL